MANCFQLISKETGEPEKLQDIDARICAFLEEPVSETDWCHYWYQSIGFGLAVGETFKDLKVIFLKAFPDPQAKALYKITEFLDNHYTADVWGEIG